MGKNVLIVAGAEGRGYALGWKLNREGHNVYIAPGNGAIEHMGIGQTAPIPVSDFKGLADYAEANKIDLTIVGPEDPLAMGIVDYFRNRELRIFGPTGKQARLEADKIYSNELLHAYGIPAPAGESFTTFKGAQNHLVDNFNSTPYVVKARGLHGGKGVIVPNQLCEALRGLETVMGVDGFNDDVLLQEFLEGREVSVTSLVGNGVLTMTGSKDYKAVGENRNGIDPRSNTGGMGVLSPNPWLPDERMVGIDQKIVIPTINAVEAETGERYIGVAYGALMLTDDPDRPEQVIEFNVRFGAPECEVLMMRMRSDLLPYLEAAVDGNLGEMPPIEWDPRVAMGVVIATPGYPTSVCKENLGLEFRGVCAADHRDDAEIFFAGVREDGGVLRNSGGRVALATVLADNWEEAREKVYDLIGEGNAVGLGRGSEDTQYRSDIGLDALERD